MATFSKNYADTVAAMPPTSGVPDSALNGVSPQYIVAITANLGTPVINQATGALGWNPNTISNEFTVYAFLQEKITLRAASTWEGVTEDIPGATSLLKAADTVSQALAGRSTISTWSTRRKWAGSEPIGIHMKLKFESFSDPYREVILPCVCLQGLTLPRGGILNAMFMIPPGPNPFDFSNKGGTPTERNEDIALSIGSFLNFDSVIIKNVSVTYENRMSSNGPIGAEVEIDIETYQMLTREDLFKSINSGTTSMSNLGNIGIGVGGVVAPKTPKVPFTGFSGGRSGGGGASGSW
jgi:uncharacterized membrane protein YgcG